MQTEKNNTTWIIIDPVDTLFFRGAESMVAGENHEVDTLFPPIPQTIIGAVRTAVMGQQSIAPAVYFAAPEKFPFLGPPDQPGFSLVGPLFLANGETILLPAPANWHTDLSDELAPKLEVRSAAPLEENTLGLKGSNGSPFWVRKPQHDNLKSLGGWWTTAKTLQSMAAGQTTIPVVTDISRLSAGGAALLPPSALYDREERLGIALTSHRTAKDGHLYTTVHIRLRSGVELAAKIVSKHEVPLADAGVLQLGGEQRLCRYRLSQEFDFPAVQGNGLVMSLSPMRLADLPETLASAPRASGKIFRVGGWDMKEGFHKPMRAWLPSGTVFAVDRDTLDHCNFIAI